MQDGNHARAPTAVGNRSGFKLRAMATWAETGAGFGNPEPIRQIDPILYMLRRSPRRLYMRAALERALFVAKSSRTVACTS